MEEHRSCERREEKRLAEKGKEGGIQKSARRKYATAIAQIKTNHLLHKTRRQGRWILWLRIFLNLEACAHGSSSFRGFMPFSFWWSWSYEFWPRGARSSGHLQMCCGTIWTLEREMTCGGSPAVGSQRSTLAWQATALSTSFL